MIIILYNSGLLCGHKNQNNSVKPVFICDSVSPSPQTMVLASGGQDGAICLWDVLTGSRVRHVYGHRGDVTSLVCTTSCVISSGLDDLICIWDRSTGIKLYSIQQVQWWFRFYTEEMHQSPASVLLNQELLFLFFRFKVVALYGLKLLDCSIKVIFRQFSHLKR